MPDDNSPWLTLHWSRWIDFSSDDFSSIATGAGLYRIRTSEGGRIVYVGQTGRSLRGRLQALRRNALWEEMPWNDPHTAAPCLWALRQEGCAGYQCSAASFPHDARLRKAVECWLIWRHRCEAGESPAANFGRMPVGYTKSRNRSTGQRGMRTAIAALEDLWTPALSLQGVPVDVAWMGLDWSEWEPMTTRLTYEGAAVYRLRSPAALLLQYIGETSTLRARITDHLKRFGKSLEVSYSRLSDASKSARLELETDLIGAHLESTGRAPALQFSGDGTP